MKLDEFSLRKRLVPVGDARVAFCEEGDGEPLLLLHGCPFSSFVWRKVIPELSGFYRCLAPDLLGLGDTETPPEADWSLPAQERMILGFLEELGIERAHSVGHDHGGAGLAAPRRITPSASIGSCCPTPRPTTTGHPGTSVRL